MDLLIFLTVVALFALIGYTLYKAGKHKSIDDEIFEEALKVICKKSMNENKNDENDSIDNSINPA